MEQTPVIKRFYASPRMSGSISAFYDLKKQVEEVTRTANYLQSTSRPDQYAQYMKENGMLLNLKPLISNIDKDLKALRKMRNVIDSAKDITPEQKRASLDRIREAENAVTARMREVRKAASKQ
jgi:glycyl-tRNA synthetase alpha subunit